MFNLNGKPAKDYEKVAEWNALFLDVNDFTFSFVLASKGSAAG